MYKHEIELRVRYGETDQMGFVYYGHYAHYFEVARVEMLRSLGISYKNMEEEGVLLPVVDFKIQYMHPARYDDLLAVQTTISVLPTAKIAFSYEVLNEEKTLICKASTVLVFVDKQSLQPMKAPQYILEALSPHFTSNG